MSSQLKGFFALIAIGKPAVPGLISALEHPDPGVRLLTAKAISCIGPSAKEAVPALIRRVRVEQGPNKRGVVLALGGIGPQAKAAVPVLIEEVRSSAPHSAVEALSGIGPGAREAIPALLEAMRSSDELLSVFAAYSLRKIDPNHKAPIPHLIGLLRKTKSELTLMCTVCWLGEFGPAARDACPALLQALEDRSDQIRARAAEALWKVDPTSKAPVPALIRLLES